MSKCVFLKYILSSSYDIKYQHNFHYNIHISNFGPINKNNKGRNITTHNIYQHTVKNMRLIINVLQNDTS